METGQESAQTLLVFLEKLSHPALGVNFDPANMILYGKGDPVLALEVLAPWVKHLHIKDARRSVIPEQWGEEVVWGDGDFDNETFLKTLNSIGYKGALAIEREAGSQPLQDIEDAAYALREFSN
jgi:sugar phosphate isomerase/epimerase